MQKTREKKQTKQPEHLEFLNKGLACHALCLLEHAGICKILKKKGRMSETDIFSFSNPALIRAALVTLVGAKLFTLSGRGYQFTRLGENLHRNIGIIFMPLVGYRYLFAKQFELASDPTKWDPSDIDYSTIATSSVDFGFNDLDPKLLEIFHMVQPKGTICDLGCGTGEKLVKICKEMNSSGLGIEKDPSVIKKNRKLSQHNRRIEILQGDITNLSGTWEDVDVAMISMVYHDITPSEQSVKFLKSICTHFPRLRCLIIADIVSISETHPTTLPGFDYVHGLQGIIPRNYEQMVKTFEDANFRIMKEAPVPNIPNMFVWAIVPN